MTAYVIINIMLFTKENTSFPGILRQDKCHSAIQLLKVSSHTNHHTSCHSLIKMDFGYNNNMSNLVFLPAALCWWANF